MSIHEYEWKMNEEELKDEWVDMNIKWKMNKEELKDDWVDMNMNER